MCSRQRILPEMARNCLLGDNIHTCLIIRTSGASHMYTYMVMGIDNTYLPAQLVAMILDF